MKVFMQKVGYIGRHAVLGIVRGAAARLKSNRSPWWRTRSAIVRIATPSFLIRSAVPAHVRRVHFITDHLEGEIGLDARAHVEAAAVKQWPAAAGVHLLEQQARRKRLVKGIRSV
jgi:hypothetical protein